MFFYAYIQMLGVFWILKNIHIIYLVEKGKKAPMHV